MASEPPYTPDNLDPDLDDRSSPDIPLSASTLDAANLWTAAAQSMGGDSDPFAAAMEAFANQVEGLKGNDRSAYDDLDFYSRYVMGYGDSALVPNSRFLSQVYNELQYTDDQNFLVLGPRQSAKSTAITVTYTTWEIGRNPLLRIMVAVASVQMQGQGFARQIDQILTQNERYIKIFGELKPPIPTKWTETEKIVKRVEPPAGMKDPTLTVVGLGSNVPSRRADRVICDDLVTQENAYSETLRKRVYAFVVQSLFPILVPGGRRIIVGSRWDPRDLYSQLAAEWGLVLPPPADIGLDEIAQYAQPAEQSLLGATVLV